MKQGASAWLLAAATATFAASVAFAQTPAPSAPPAPPIFPAEMKNRQVFPPGTGGAQLRDIMRSFAVSLGVRCTHCHVGEEGQPLSTFDFASDAKPKKQTAREMIRLVQHLNEERLPAIAGVDGRVTCFTCHRGSTTPATRPPEPAPAPPPAAPPASPAERG